MDSIGVFEAIYSQRQFTRYKPDLVPREAIDKIIDAATKAPSGGNTQPWHFIAITERDLIEEIGGLYRDLWLGAMGATPPPGESPAYTSARYLANHMPEVPAMILVCAYHTVGTVPYTKGDPIEQGRLGGRIEEILGGNIRPLRKDNVGWRKRRRITTIILAMRKLCRHGFNKLGYTR